VSSESGSSTNSSWLSHRAPAKLNIGLAITGRRPDGYHELRSIFLRISLADELRVRVDDDEDADLLAIEGDPACPVVDNLVLRAVALARATLAPAAAPLQFQLTKRIPMGGGLGGGSSDAAAALRVALQAWRLAPNRAALDGLAARLGADVPFFLQHKPAALVTGVGERLEPLPGVPADLGVLLFVPHESVGTAAAFDAFDRGIRPSPLTPASTIDELAAGLRRGTTSGEFAEWGGLLRDANDLWPAALSLVPALGQLRDRLERAIERPVLMSGSGSTLFALYPSTEAADAGVETLRSEHATLAAGARLVTTAGVDESSTKEEP
jgi:4-diphosphocytidyl-2-C-methyl-D-erythritol kinase